ncbi:hypothetical protein BDZ88DRAFT_403316 [Geranomyces variabilis]|nr:hypothetical protein BDZ88DRAFT_403316 [Geranomyces variabilis]
MILRVNVVVMHAEGVAAIANHADCSAVSTGTRVDRSWAKGASLGLVLVFLFLLVVGTVVIRRMHKWWVHKSSVAGSVVGRLWVRVESISGVLLLVSGTKVVLLLNQLLMMVIRMVEMKMWKFRFCRW